MEGGREGGRGETHMDMGGIDVVTMTRVLPGIQLHSVVLHGRRRSSVLTYTVPVPPHHKHTSSSQYCNM